MVIKWSDSDLADLIKFIDTRVASRSKFFLCNRIDNTEDQYFKNECGQYNVVTFPVTYTAGRKKKTDTGHEAKQAYEVLVYN
jgi:DNA adenine methylase